MSVFFTVIEKNSITMISDSQGTNPDDGSMIHNAQKLWKLDSATIAAIGGDSKIGELILKVASETLAEMDRLNKANVVEWVQTISDVGQDLFYSFSNQVTQDSLTLVQVAGVLSFDALQLQGILVTQELSQAQPIYVDTTFPIYIVPPRDVPYKDCENILYSIAHQKFPHKDRLTAHQWVLIARQAVAEISNQSRYVDNLPQQLTIHYGADGLIEIYDMDQ